MLGVPEAAGSLGGLIEIVHLLKKSQGIHLGGHGEHAGVAHDRPTPTVGSHNMIVRPAVEPMLLRLCAHRFVGDLRHVYTACLSVDTPHSSFLERELFYIPRHDHCL